MRNFDIRRAVSLSVLAAGLATSAFGQAVPGPGPFQFYSEQPVGIKGSTINTHQFDLDFTKTSLNPALNFSTFPNPRSPSNIVKYESYFIFTNIAPGACFEMTSAGPAGSDLLLSVQNQAGNWVWLADDNNGNAQFRARLFIKSGAQYNVRISQYFSPNNNDQDGIGVRKINLDPGSVITATSCRAAGVPFWQIDQNLGNPYDPS